MILLLQWFLKYGCIYAISQQGTLFLYDIQTGRHVFSIRVSNVCSVLQIIYRQTTQIRTDFKQILQSILN